MAALVRRDTTAPSTLNQTTYPSASFTPTAADLLVVIVAASAEADDPAVLTASANGITFAQRRADIDATISAGVAIYCFVADQLVGASPAAMTVTVDFGADAASGAHIVVLAATGMTNVGAAAVRQSGAFTNTAGGTPAVTLAAAALTTNPLIAYAINLTNSTTTLTPPTSFTERYDNGYATPTTGCEVSTRDSGHTSATVTAGSSMSAGLFAVVELDASAGTSLNRSASDSAPATDAVVAGVTTARALADAAAGSDVDVRGSTRSRAQADTAAASDSTSAAVTHTIARSTSDTAAASDTTARTLVLARPQTDSAPAADVTSRARISSRALADAAAATDTSARLVVAQRAILDAAPASDTTAASTGGAIARSLSDSAPANDTTTRSSTRARSIADSAAAVDADARSSTRARAQADTAPASDVTSANVTHTIARATSDSAPASDVDARNLRATRATADVAAAVDSVSVKRTASRVTSEAASASDLAARSLRAVRAQLDVALAADTTSGSVEIAPDVTSIVVTVGLRPRGNSASFEPRTSADILLSDATTARLGTRGTSAAIREREVDVS